MRRTVISGLLPFVFYLSVGQTLSPDLWHAGKVVLDSGDTLQGLVKYDPHDLLQVKHQNQLESFSPKKVTAFEIFDQSCKQKRIFYSLPYALGGDYKSPVFFEVMSQGRITLLAREAISVTTISTAHIGYPPRRRRVVEIKYFLLKENGEIEPFHATRDSWLELTSSKMAQVQIFVTTHKLDLDEKYDIKRIIDYYNSLY